MKALFFVTYGAIAFFVGEIHLWAQVSKAPVGWIDNKGVAHHGTPPLPSNGNNSVDYGNSTNEQQRREQEATQRQIDEARRKQEIEAAQRRQEQFEVDKRATISQLKGTSGIENGLKGLSDSTTFGQLKGLQESGDVSKSPNGDPRVVDARNVPSGLPAFVLETIPNTEAGARVRKGYQAVMAQDWKVALAWFQDARNHEPNNPQWQRLVDFAQFTLNSRNQTLAPVSGKNSGSVQSVDNAPVAAPRRAVLQPAQDADMKLLFPLGEMTMPRTKYVEKVLQEHPQLKSAIVQEWLNICHIREGGDVSFLAAEEAAFNASVSALVGRMEGKP